jgi:hypothetical protein
MIPNLHPGRPDGFGAGVLIVTLPDLRQKND